MEHEILLQATLSPIDRAHLVRIDDGYGLHVFTLNNLKAAYLVRDLASAYETIKMLSVYTED